uniref:F-box associated domain-containing protein n=1 Tax=Aegilops tauschii TaxID=37682 RepID=N1R1J8_AEGTA
MTGRQRKLKVPVSMGYINGATALLCVASDCDHHCVAHACVSLPVSGDWSKSCSDFEWSDMCFSLQLAPNAFIDSMPSILVENALHFMLTHNDDDSVEVLKYDLSSNYLSMIDAPLSGTIISGSTILIAMEDVSLGFAHVDTVTLNMWSRQLDSNGFASWTMPRVVELMNLIPIQNPIKRLRLIGSVEGSDIIFITADLGIYEVNIRTLQWKRKKFRYLIPYMSFYNPPASSLVFPSELYNLHA